MRRRIDPLIVTGQNSVFTILRSFLSMQADVAFTMSAKEMLNVTSTLVELLGLAYRFIVHICLWG
jgi:hypothetical protein